MFYTGIGSRNTPQDIQEMMIEIATNLKNKGFTLRSGAAHGADSAFAKGAGDQLVEYIPWDGFSDKYHNGKTCVALEFVNSQERDEAAATASDLHPVYHKLGHGAQCLHTRNVFQILGHVHTEPESEFVIFWAEPHPKTGQVMGGTATAVRLARRNLIPVYNLASFLDREELFEMIDKL